MDEHDRGTDVKVGIFVLSALLILVAGSLWIAGFTITGARRVPYAVLMRETAGIQAGDRVRFAGVPVGRVQRVRLRPEDDWPVVLEIALRPDIPVKTDSTARIAMSGLMGTSFLQIDPGSPGAPRLAPGGELHGRAGMGIEETLGRVDEISVKVIALLDQTSGILDQVAREVGPILSRMEQLLSQDNVDDTRHMIVDLHRTVEDVGPRISALLARVDSAAENLDEGLEHLPRVTSRISALMEDLRSAIGPDGRRLAGVLDAAEGGLTSADEALAVLRANRREIEMTLRDLRDTVANLKAFSQQVKERPFSLVRIKPPAERQPGDGVESRP